MFSKLDEVITAAEQSNWAQGSLRDGAEGLRPAPVIGDEPYDERLRQLMLLPEWPAYSGFLRGYIENGIPKPFETQPTANQIGWWNITINENATQVHVNIWRQFAAVVEFLIEPDDQLRGYGTVWLDKQTVESAMADGAALPNSFAVEATTLQGRERGVLALRMMGVSFDDIVTVFNHEWVVRAVRILNLDLMRGGQLNFGWKRFHIPKLVDAVFAEGEETPASPAPEATASEENEPVLDTEVEALVWRRKNMHRFVEPVFLRAGNRCEVTGVGAVRLLQACHIKPFSESGQEERLDAANGLCLAIHVHAAFDAHLIGIKPSGELVVSDRLSEDDRARLNLPKIASVRVDSEREVYLTYRFDQYLRAQSAGMIALQS